MFPTPGASQSSVQLFEHAPGAGKVVKCEAVNRAVKAIGSRWAAELRADGTMYSGVGVHVCLYMHVWRQIVKLALS